jgi:hypothetical protein
MTLNVPAGFGILAYKFGLSSDAEVMVMTIGVDINFGSPGPQAKVDSKADSFANSVVAANMTGGYSFLGCTLRAGGGAGGSTVYEAPRLVVGTAPPSALPNNCAYLIHKLTARAGRRGRGRMFMPPYVIAETQVNNNGILDPPDLVGLQGLVDQALPGDDFVLFHDILPSVLAPDPITNLVVDRQIATQRRRMRS